MPVPVVDRRQPAPGRPPAGAGPGGGGHRRRRHPNHSGWHCHTVAQEVHCCSGTGTQAVRAVTPSRTPSRTQALALRLPVPGHPAGRRRLRLRLAGGLTGRALDSGSGSPVDSGSGSGSPADSRLPQWHWHSGSGPPPPAAAATRSRRRRRVEAAALSRRRRRCSGVQFKFCRRGAAGRRSGGPGPGPRGHSVTLRLALAVNLPVTVRLQVEFHLRLPVAGPGWHCQWHLPAAPFNLKFRLTASGSLPLYSDSRRL